MRVIVTIEQRFDQTQDGSVWTSTNYANAFWQRYRTVFDQVLVLARVHNVSSVPDNWIRANGEGVSFAALPYYLGPWQYLQKAQQIRRAELEAIKHTDAVILRIPSQIASAIVPAFRRARRPYGVEVVGDPAEVFAPGAIQTPWRRFFRWWFPRQMRQQCAHACAGSYVTEQTLQRRYPLAVGAFATNYSSVELPEEAYAGASRPAVQPGGVVRLIILASLAHRQKGVDTLLDALAICLKQGAALNLTVAGDGKHRQELENQTAALGLGEYVRFVGQLSPASVVRAHLDEADVFVLPSRQEGLPRSIIEAMARALPCIGSSVGGTPELLPPEDMVPPDDPVALAQKILELIADPARMVRSSVRNLEKARQYHDSVLSKRRLDFLCAVQEETRRWISKQDQHAG